MATITRCDCCKQLSDEPGVGYIGKEFEVRDFKSVVMIIKTMRDSCIPCVKKNVLDNNLRKYELDY